MKHLLVALTLVHLPACISTGKAEAQGVALPELRGHREHVVDGLTYDAANRVTARHTFLLTNSAQVPIVFENARVTTSTVLSPGIHGSLVIAPGESVTWDLQVTVFAPEPQKRGRATLTTSTGETVELVLQLRVADA